MPNSFIFLQCGVPEVIDELPLIQITNRLGVIGRFWQQQYAFDQNAQYRASVKDVPAYGRLTKIWAYTIYNPTFSMPCEWIQCGKYDPKAIVAHVRAGLVHDDDIIQQWFGASDVIKLLERADSFPTMVPAVRCICGAHESDDDARRYVESVL